jgi:phage terminase small subunit
MGRTRDPKRDEAKEIYKAANGEIDLVVIAAQLGVPDGTIRGWKAKDKWDKLLTGESVDVERANAKERNAPIPEANENDGVEDELFLNAVLIVVEAKQASASLLQRRMRIGYTRAARLIDEMEKRGFVGPYIGTSPREVLIKEFDPAELKRPTVNKKERNAPKKDMERSINTERSEEVKNAPLIMAEPAVEDEIDDGEPDENGLTPKEALFVKYYLINFNATQAAMKSGYSTRSARYIGYQLLTKLHIKAAIKKYNEEITAEIGLNVQRIITEYMKVAFSDMTEFVEFGNKDEPVMTEEGPAIDPASGEAMTYKRNFVTFKNSDEVDGTLISEVKQGKEGISVKLHDKMKALDVLNKYHDILPDHHKRMIEEEKLKLDKERFEFEKLKAAGEGDLDEELIDDWVKAVMDDGSEDRADGGDEERDQ